MTAGYWQTNYFPTDYWQEDYWQDYGYVAPPSGTGNLFRLWLLSGRI